MANNASLWGVGKCVNARCPESTIVLARKTVIARGGK